LQVQERVQTHQLHGLDDTGVADHEELAGTVVEQLGQLHEGAESGGVNEIDAAEVDDDRKALTLVPIADELGELLVGIGVQLSRETEQQALIPPFAAPSQGDGQSLQVGDGSNPRRQSRGV
jgi:hypothetical protein